MGTHDAESTWFKPAILNFGLGLVATITAAAVPVGISLWADVRMLSRDLGTMHARVVSLETFERDQAGFTPSDARRLGDRIAAIELELARHEASTTVKR